MDWVRYELRNYMVGRRCLFAGAEAAVFEKLSHMPEFHECSRGFLELSADTHFLALTGKIADDLDELKSTIAQQIDKHGIDTLFLSLGGGAKILCAELAQEHGICCFDFGGLMRGLTYSGSDGQMFCRSTHHPFFYRVPFDVYMDALEQVFPDYRPVELLCKAQCQVYLEGTSHKVGESVPTPDFRISKQELPRFRETYQRYWQRYKNLAKRSKATRLFDLGFRMCVSELISGRGTGYWIIRLQKAILRRIHPNDF
jgi:hypothetical protein